MDIVVTGRHCTISEDVREQITGRIAGIEKLRNRVIRVEVEFTAQESRGSRDHAMLCELTLRGKGPVVRAEGSAEDKIVAFDKALDKLKTQLRRASDRRKNHHGLRASQVLVEMAPEAAPVDDSPQTHTVAGDLQMTGEGPLVVREKEFTSAPLTLAQALDEMELVGHDFFLYVDADSGLPSVAYRRKGYDYGVIHLNKA